MAYKVESGCWHAKARKVRQPLRQNAVRVTLLLKLPSPGCPMSDPDTCSFSLVVLLATRTPCPVHRRCGQGSFSPPGPQPSGSLAVRLTGFSRWMRDKGPVHQTPQKGHVESDALPLLVFLLHFSCDRGTATHVEVRGQLTGASSLPRAPGTAISRPGSKHFYLLSRLASPCRNASSWG